MFESVTKPIWWLPTIGLFIFLALELSMFVEAGKRFEDPGVGRHLRTAEVILETGKIPQTDPLSFNHAGEPWFDFEWAFEATLGELYRLGGLALIAAFSYALFGVTLLVVFRTLLQSGISLGAVFLYMGLAFLTLHLHFLVRPVLFTYLFMAVVVEVWNRQTKPRLMDWLILPLVFAAWANLHAGWLAGLVFIALSLTGRLADRVTGRVDGETAPLVPWMGLSLVCTLATTLNPWGWALHRHIYLMATSFKSSALWDEYLPPNFSGPSMSAVAVLFILGVIILARVSRKAPLWRWEIALPVIFFLYEGLKTQRHVLLLVEVAAIPIARDMQAISTLSWPNYLRTRFPFLTDVIEGVGGRLKEFQANQRQAGGDAWLVLILAVFFGMMFMRAPIGRDIPVGKVPPQLLTFLKDHPDRFHRPLTTTWNAGPLLWNLRPDFRVSMDDRGDFYGDEVVFSFVDMTNGSPGWREKFEKGNYDSLILEPQLPLIQLIHLMPEWKEVYRDAHAVVYWKDEPVHS